MLQEHAQPQMSLFQMQEQPMLRVLMCENLRIQPSFQEAEFLAQDQLHEQFLVLYLQGQILVNYYFYNSYLMRRLGSLMPCSLKVVGTL